MAVGVGAMIAGGLASSIGSGIFNSASSAISAHQQYKNQTKLNKQTYKYNVKLQNHQNKFTQSMFDQSAKLAASAHQIEVADLRAAGLNPILSATGGNGASLVSPMSGGSASMSGGSAQSVEPGKVDLLNAYNTAKQLKNDTQRVKNETKQTENNTELKDSQLGINDAQKGLYDSQKTQQDLNNNLTFLYGAAQREKELNLLDMNSAKVAQDIENSKLITASTLDLNKSLKEANSASAWYNRHRALGFSESSSESDSYDKGGSESYGSISSGLQGSLGGKHGASAGFNFGTPSRTSTRNNARSRSRSYSRSW